MKLYFYRGDVANFGDELNHWLLPQVFKNFFDDDDSTMFLGIGSILFDHHPAHPRKIVFGAGFGGYTAPPKIDDTWKFYCVRGPRTATAMGLTADLVAGDSAILINQFYAPSRTQSTKFSFIPHFQSLPRGHWQEACRLAGVHFIDPTQSVDDVLREITASGTVIAEAMHGAIVADALRVPWVPILPFDTAHHLKWYDWAEALDIRLRRHRLAPSSAREAWIMSRGRDPARLRDARGLLRHATRGLDAVLTGAAALTLYRAARQEPTMSTDAALQRVLERLNSSADRIRQDFPATTAG